MPIFSGLDIDAYPGDDNIKHIVANSNVAFVGFYLGPAPAHPETDWMDKLAFLRSAGLGVAPIFLGHQTAGPGARLEEDAERAGAQGRTDGLLAADLMTKAGFAPASWVYLDRENPATTPAERAYILAWAGAVRMRQFCPGVYCSHVVAELVSQWVPGARVWVYKVPTVEKHDASRYGGTFPLVDPHAGGFAYAYLWQHEVEAEVHVAGLFLTVDLDVSILKDPSSS